MLEMLQQIAGLSRSFPKLSKRNTHNQCYTMYKWTGFDGALPDKYTLRKIGVRAKDMTTESAIANDVFIEQSTKRYVYQYFQKSLRGNLKKLKQQSVF